MFDNPLQGGKLTRGRLHDGSSRGFIAIMTYRTTVFLTTKKGNSAMTEKSIRIMPCLDIHNGRVVKGVHFVDLRDAGDPVSCAQAYIQAGADELTFLDITATVEDRGTILETVRRVAEVCTVPLTVGGGISSLDGARAVLQAGADRISISSAAYRNPDLIPSLVQEFGPDKIVAAIDVDRNASLPSGYEVYIDGGRTATGEDGVRWAETIDRWGVSTILPTSKATDGARTGYDLPLIKTLSRAVSAAIVASGGAGTMEHFLQAAQAGAEILLAASVFHFNTIQIPQLKQYLRENGVKL